MHKLAPPPTAPIRQALASLLAHSDAVQTAHRLHALLLVGLGLSCYEVARLFDESPRTVERWVRHYSEAGLAGLERRHGGGRRSALAAEQIAALAIELRDPPERWGHAQRRWSGKLLQRHLDRRYGVMMGTRQCQRLLRQLRGPVAAPATRPPLRKQARLCDYLA